MKNLPSKANLPVNFLWRDQRGNMHNVSSMETSHLFNTLSMIWNHVMPEEAKTHEYKRYQFSSYYSVAYMKDAIRSIYAELSNRQDIKPYMKDRLAVMQRYLFKEKRIKHAQKI